MRQKDSRRRQLLKRYFPIVIIGVYIVAGSIIWEYNRLRVSEIRSVGETRQESILKLQHKTFETHIKNLFIDIMELSNRQIFRDYIDEPSKERKELVQQAFSNFVGIKRTYGKALFLDAFGMEKICVDRGPGGIPITAINDHMIGSGDKSFYNESIRLDDNSVFISNISLDRTESNKVIYPYRPVVKISLPVTNSNKEKLGVVVLYMDVHLVIQEIVADRNILIKDRSVSGQQYLVNHNGYYLHHPDTSKLWGFGIDDRSRCNFNLDFPKVSGDIRKSESGIIESGSDQFTYLAIDILSMIENSSKENGYNYKAISQYGKRVKPIYKIISRTPKNLTDGWDSDLIRRFSIVLIILFILLTAASYFVALLISNKVSKDEKIRESQKQLEKANVTKDKFIKILAHDLKNPITSIQAFSEILSSEESAFSQEQRLAFSKLIGNSTKTMLQLIDDVLSWSKSQSGDLKVDSDHVDLSEVVEYALSLSEIQAERKGIALETTLAPFSYIYADPNMIVTIIRNLVSNAIKFSNREDVVSIEVEILDKRVFLRIIDRGIGMGVQKVEKLFDVGVKDYTKGTENESGTGLGMVLCKEFTEKNRGKIKVYSKLKEGTVVTVSFPLSEMPEISED